MQLIVLGMHRSGTSVLARLLNMMGAYFGPEGASTGANAENPKGFWERRDVRQLNDFVLHSVGCDWDSIADFEISELPEAVLKEFGDRAANIILEMDAHRPWLLKEPRLCLLLELWKKYLEVPVCIHIYRNPLEVAQSLNYRNGIPVLAGIALWEKYNLAALKASKELPRFVVSHNRLITAPETEVKAIYEQLLNFDVTGLHLPTKKEITSFINSELYHQRVDENTLVQYLNGSQAQMFDGFSTGRILGDKNSHVLSESGELILREYEQKEKLAQTVKLEQETHAQQDAELNKQQTEQKKALNQQLEQQTQTAKAALDEANQREAELNKQLLDQEKALSQQLEQQAQTAKETLDEATRRITELSKQNTHLEGAISKLQSRKLEIQKELAEVESQKFDLKKAALATANKLWNKDQTIDSLEEELLLKQQEITDKAQLAESRQLEIRQLTRWMRVIEFHLGSWRWRGGRSAIGAFAKVIGKSGGDINADEIYNILADFRAWNHSNNNAENTSQLALTNDINEKSHRDRHFQLLHSSGLFNTDWYLNEYPDVKQNGMHPIEHYLKFGAKERRNPGPDFDTKWYLLNNPDIESSGINPLEHYVLYGRDELRSPMPLLMLESPRNFGEEIGIVVTVFNALSDVKKCLKSVRNKRDGFIVDVTVVNDGSDEQTTAWLQSFCGTNDRFHLIEHEENQGYTKAVNSGLKASTAAYVIILNSDTIVTNGWLKGLIRCINSDSDVGIAGPLSSAASWQNVPDLYDENGSFAINKLPENMSPDDMARIVTAASSQIYPKTPFVNGFCFMIRREVIDAIGIMDEENFPIGYGEENDYCIRAADAGFKLAIADNSYVFHAKSKSFGHDRRKELSKQGSDAIKRKHTEAKFKQLVEQVKNTTLLDKVRLSIKNELNNIGKRDGLTNITSMKILFLLPVKGGSGGAHSVVQEVTTMRKLGVDANIAVKENDQPRLLDIYHDIEDVNEVFIGFSAENIFSICKDFDVVVGTIFNSIALLKQIVHIYPHILPAYYIQDYEPLFYPAESENWLVARESYSLIPNALLFAKTHWIANMVEQEHGVIVHKVSPSIDHDVYKPGLEKAADTVCIAAMIRPKTPRRGAERTMRLLSQLAKEFAEKISFRLFGCDENDNDFKLLPREFNYNNGGVLTRPEVATLLAKSDIFIDLSDYQAFGRTALEAMACGCAAMVPIHGGTDEYAIDEVNALVVDSFDEETCLARLSDLVRDKNKLKNMQREGLKTALNFSVDKAAASELTLFGKFLPEHRKRFPLNKKPKLYLMPSRGSDKQPTASGYARILLPYKYPEVWRDWDILECSANNLPQAGEADTVIIHRDAGEVLLKQLKLWLEAWRAAGGTLIYDVDEDMLNIKSLNKHYPGTDIDKLLRKVTWLAQQADIVTVSTPESQSKLLKLNANVMLVPDLLDTDKWKVEETRQSYKGWLKRENPNAIYIGYIGTQWDAQNLKNITAAMCQIEKEFGDRVEIEVIGGFQHISPLFGSRVGLPKNTEYPAFVDWLHRRVDWDIGIIPLQEGAVSQSNLSFLECAALNLAIVCSDVKSDGRIAVHENNALVVRNTTQAWYTAIKCLIEDSEKRTNIARKAHSDILSRYTLAQNVDVFLKILNNTINLE